MKKAKCYDCGEEIDVECEGVCICKDVYRCDECYEREGDSI